MTRDVESTTCRKFDSVFRAVCHTRIVSRSQILSLLLPTDRKKKGGTGYEAMRDFYNTRSYSWHLILLLLLDFACQNMGIALIVLRLTVSSMYNLNRTCGTKSDFDPSMWIWQLDRKPNITDPARSYCLREFTCPQAPFRYIVYCSGPFMLIETGRCCVHRLL